VNAQFLNGFTVQLFQMEAFCKVNLVHMVGRNRISHLPAIRSCG
jgi:hypothetical protein